MSVSNWLIMSTQHIHFQETKTQFRKSLAESRKKLEKLHRAQRKWIQRSKPYYELKQKLQQVSPCSDLPF